MSVTVQLPSAECRVITTRQRGSLDHVTKRIRSNSKFACRRWATVTKAFAKKTAPVDTGYMKTQIKAEKSGIQTRSRFAWEVYVDGLVTPEKGAFYAVYVEYGTRYMRAQPFFWPGVRAGHHAFMYAMVNVYKRRGSL